MKSIFKKTTIFKVDLFILIVTNWIEKSESLKFLLLYLILYWVIDMIVQNKWKHNILLTKVVATDSGNTAAVIENAATSAAVEPNDSVILNKNDNEMNILWSSIKSSILKKNKHIHNDIIFTNLWNFLVVI